MVAFEIVAYLMAAVASCAATLGAVWLRHKLQKDEKCDTVAEETKHNENVYAALNFALEEMGADRAYVLEFHNGIHYFSGRSQQKFSCTYEIVQEGISTECQASQDHKISTYHTYISELVKNEKFEYTDIKHIEDHVFGGLLRHKGVKSIYNVPIKTLNGKIIGILGVDYVKQHAVKDNAENNTQAKIFNEDTSSFMQRQARVMAGYLL